MTMTIRDATPDDVPFLAWAMLTASRSHLARGLYEFMMDSDEALVLEFLASVAVVGPTHMNHWSAFRVATVDGAPAAALCTFERGIDAEAANMQATMAVCPALGLDPTTPDAIRRIGVARSGIVAGEHGPAGPRLVIENVATHPSQRRRGLARLLLDDALARAKAAGYPAVQVGCYLGNDAARAAYLDAGFEVIAEQRSDAWAAELGCDGTELLVHAF